MATYKCENCGREAVWLSEQKDIYCAQCGYGKLLPLIANKEPVAKLQFERGVIKPCPFCGHTAIDAPIFDVDDEGDQKASAVVCLICGAWGATKENVDDAIEAWNKRAV